MYWCNSEKVFCPFCNCIPKGHHWQIRMLLLVVTVGSHTVKLKKKKCCLWNEHFFFKKENLELDSFMRIKELCQHQLRRKASFFSYYLGRVNKILDHQLKLSNIPSEWGFLNCSTIDMLIPIITWHVVSWALKDTEQHLWLLPIRYSGPPISSSWHLKCPQTWPTVPQASSHCSLAWELFL